MLVFNSCDQINTKKLNLAIIWRHKNSNSKRDHGNCKAEINMKNADLTTLDTSLWPPISAIVNHIQVNPHIAINCKQKNSNSKRDHENCKSRKKYVQCESDNKKHKIVTVYISLNQNYINQVLRSNQLATRKTQNSKRDFGHKRLQKNIYNANQTTINISLWSSISAVVKIT